MLQCDPPCHNRLLQLLGCRACAWGNGGMDAARQWAQEAEGDGGRGAGGPCMTCRCDKRRGHRRKVEGPRASG
jgi:hypothetical protein